MKNAQRRAKDASPNQPAHSGISRRAVLSAAGVGIAGIASGAFLGTEIAENKAKSPKLRTVDMFGTHQAGIATEAQDRMHTAAFDLTTEDRDQVIQLLKDWTAAIESMVQGQEIGEYGATGGNYDAPPEDTGEAIDLDASHLTVTIGFGRSLFLQDGTPRFGLSGKLPDALIELPHFPGDALESNRSDGDIIVQACADDPQVAVHAVRNLSRIAFGKARVRWSQIGFGRTSSTTRSQHTPRNLFGFKDGTASIKAEDTETMNTHVWVSGMTGNQAWLNGGSYLVMRRIRMHIETWDRAPLSEQEMIVGRTKREGAPLSGGTEFTEPDFAMPGRGGPIIDANSHLALAHPEQNNGVQMLRRGFNYTDGSDQLGRLDAGLFFLAFVTDPRTHFVPMQNALAKNDLLSEYLKHTGSGLYAIAPGITKGQYLGQQLFDS